MHVQITSRDETWTKIGRTAVYSVACVTFPLYNCRHLETEEGCWGRRESWFTDLLAHARLLTPVTLSGAQIPFANVFRFLFNFVPKYAPASLISGKAPFILFVV